MVQIAINLNAEQHAQLKKRATSNLRSMKNELLIILNESLNIDNTRDLKPKKKSYIEQRMEENPFVQGRN